jgi:hypothetical protein
MSGTALAEDVALDGTGSARVPQRPLRSQAG